jgi:hypothetical protein
MRQSTSHTRDAALRRISHANRWLIAGSVALTGLLADVAANAFPGRTLHKGAHGARSLGKGASRSTTSTQQQSVQPPLAPPESASSAGSGESEEGSAAGEGGSAQAPPASEAQPAQEAPSGEAAQSQQQAPAQESEPPVVSGGS